MSTANSIRVSLVSDVGKVRDTNEDNAGACKLDVGCLVVVCDGMGGHQAGEVASQLAVARITEGVRNAPGAYPDLELRDILMNVNEEIIAAGREAGRKGMGTTAIVAWIRDEGAWIAQVGDSRLYVVRGGRVVARTHDHTKVEAKLQRGEITAEEARNHPLSGVLTRALGHAKMSGGAPFEPEVGKIPLPLYPHDILVLSTDGMHDLVYDHEIPPLVSGVSTIDAANRLVGLALERGGHDNVTVAVIRVEPPPLPTEAITSRARVLAPVVRGPEANAEPPWLAIAAVVIGVGVLTMIVGCLLLLWWTGLL